MIFPSILPNCSQQYGAASNPMLAVTQFETNFRQRKRYSNDQEKVQVSWLFNQFEFDVFKKFVRDLISAGSGSFFLNIIGKDGLESREVQIVGGKYSSQYVSHAHHKVSCELLVITNSVMTNNQYNLALLTGSKVETVLESPNHPEVEAYAQATLTPNPIYVSKTQIGYSNLSVKIVSASSGAITQASFSNNEVTVTPAQKARIEISGELTSNGYSNCPSISIPFYGFDGDFPHYEDANGQIVWSPWDNAWVFTNFSPYAVFKSAYSATPASSPDLVSSWIPQGAATGTPILTPKISSVSQVVSAIYSMVGTPITAGFFETPNADILETDPVSIYLTGGSNIMVASFTNQFCKVGTEAPFTWYKWNGSVWLAHADIPVYANLTAANAALPNNTLFYDSTLSKLYVTTA